jgi:dihydroflavonol-4-reductase
MVLVTGANGFVGRHLVQYLSAQGQQVRALYHRRQPDDTLRQLPGVQWMQCDLLDVYAVEEALQGVERIYHCAAVVSFHPRDKAGMMQVNVTGTAHLVDEALVQGVQKLVYISSVAALGRNAGTVHITEEEQWAESRYNSAYAQSKYLAEMEVWRGMAEGLDAVVVNPGIILGAGDWNLGSSRLMKLAYDEFPFYTQGVNAWVDVRDVVRAAVMLMESDITAERFILSAGNYSYREVFTLMAEALKRRPPRKRATLLMTGLVWRWNMLKSVFTGATITITKETARNAQKVCYYSNDKLRRFIPDFQYTELRDTIGAMAGAFLADNGMSPGNGRF